MACMAVPAFQSGAQSTAPDDSEAPQRQVNFDLSWLGISAGFTVRNSTHTSLGVSLGAGGNWTNYMVLAGRHFAESGGVSYETKDGATDKELYEMLRGSVFMRRHFAAGRQLDLGLKASGFLHSDSSDDDPGFGAFAGMQVSGVWYRWRRLGLGSEVNVGGYFERGSPELGVNVAPVFLRVMIP